MLRKHYNNNTSSTHRPTQKVATCQVLSAKTKSIMTNEPLKVEQPLLESSSGIDKLVYDLYQIFPRHQNNRDGDDIAFS